MSLPYPISRRRFVARAAGAVTGLVAGPALIGPDGALLWTRLAPDPVHGGGMPDVDVPVFWEVADDERFRHVRQRGTALSRPAWAHSVHVELRGLRPNREYWYRFRVGGQ